MNGLLHYVVKQTQQILAWVAHLICQIQEGLRRQDQQHLVWNKIRKAALLAPVACNKKAKNSLITLKELLRGDSKSPRTPNLELVSCVFTEVEPRNSEAGNRILRRAL